MKSHRLIIFLGSVMTELLRGRRSCAESGLADGYGYIESIRCNRMTGQLLEVKEGDRIGDLSYEYQDGIEELW